MGPPEDAGRNHASLREQGQAVQFQLRAMRSDIAAAEAAAAVPEVAALQVSLQTPICGILQSLGFP